MQPSSTPTTNGPESYILKFTVKKASNLLSVSGCFSNRVSDFSSKLRNVFVITQLRTNLHYETCKFARKLQN